MLFYTIITGSYNFICGFDSHTLPPSFIVISISYTLQLPQKTTQKLLKKTTLDNTIKNRKVQVVFLHNLLINQVFRKILL